MNILGWKEGTKMKIETHMFGVIEIKDDKVITFNEGLPGFEELKKFGIIENEENSPLKHLQSLEDGNICFVIVDPYIFKKDYAPIINESYFEKLGGGEDSDFAIYSTVCLKTPLEESTLNLAGPLLIHVDNKLGIQVIAEEKMYRTKHKLIDLINERG